MGETARDMFEEKCVLMRFPCGHLFKLATLSNKRAAKDSEEALATVVLSAIAVEAFINDFAFAVAGLSTKESPSSLSELVDAHRSRGWKRRSLDTKILTMFKLLTKRDLPKNDQLRKAFALLVELRNMLVHMKTEKIVYPAPSAHPLYDRLTAQGLTLETFPRDRSCPSVLLAHCQVAEWSLRTAMATARLLLEAMPECTTANAVVRLFAPLFYSEADGLGQARHRGV